MHPLFQRWVEVTRRDEIAMLLTYGYSPLEFAPFDKVKSSRGDSSTWRFPAHGPEGETAKLLAAWRAGEDFAGKDNAHPVAWMGRFARNRAAVDEAIHNKREQILVKRGNSVGLIDPGSAQARQDEVLRKLGV